MSALRLIYDPPAAGDWNMAVDEMMLESVASTGEPILRFYTWQEPTLSLGYFQSLQERRSHPASLSCPVVRRSTGGGAILHDRELTYSVAMPLSDRWSSAAEQLYDTFHRSLIATLAAFGVEASLCKATLHPLGREPFLCFERRAKGDVLVGAHKIAGSAQRRRKECVLQHGSVLLCASPAAPDLPGLAELCGREFPSPEQFAERWLSDLLATWQIATPPQKGEWSPVEKSRSAAIQQVRFATAEWTSRRI